MALLNFFKLKDKLHDSTEASVLSKTEVEAANKQVSNALQSAAEKVSRGKYNSYTPQQRAKIGKYAAENGPTKAAKHFTTIWGIHVNESTARRLNRCCWYRVHLLHYYSICLPYSTSVHLLIQPELVVLTVRVSLAYTGENGLRKI